MVKKIMLIGCLVIVFGGFFVREIKAAVGYDSNYQCYDVVGGNAYPFPDENEGYYYQSSCAYSACVNSILQGNDPYSSNICPNGGFAMCSIDSDGCFKGLNMPNSCSCLKPRTDLDVDIYMPERVDKTDSSYVATNTCACVLKDSFYYPLEENDCEEGFTYTYCHSSDLMTNGSICTCGTAQDKFDFEKKISVYDNSPLKDKYATMSATTHIYNPTTGCSNGVSTAFGCISYTPFGFATTFLQLIFGIAGGTAFLLMVYGFIMVATSSGDEKKLQGARETITSAIIGLLICIFALFLFRLVAVNILQIPGLS